jgi:hypothetical protein
MTLGAIGFAVMLLYITYEESRMIDYSKVRKKGRFSDEVTILGPGMLPKIRKLIELCGKLKHADCTDTEMAIEEEIIDAYNDFNPVELEIIEVKK